MSDDHDFLEAQYDAAKARQNKPLLLLRELHEAMADVMVMKRMSETPRQREMSDRAVAVWRKVEAFLASRRAA